MDRKEGSHRATCGGRVAGTTDTGEVSKPSISRRQRSLITGPFAIVSPVRPVPPSTAFHNSAR